MTSFLTRSPAEQAKLIVRLRNARARFDAAEAAYADAERSHRIDSVRVPGAEARLDAARTAYNMELGALRAAIDAVTGDGE